jgi:hypothetical protein
VPAAVAPQGDRPVVRADTGGVAWEAEADHAHGTGKRGIRGPRRQFASHRPLRLSMLRPGELGRRPRPALKHQAERERDPVYARASDPATRNHVRTGLDR